MKNITLSPKQIGLATWMLNNPDKLYERKGIEFCERLVARIDELLPYLEHANVEIEGCRSWQYNVYRCERAFRVFLALRSTLITLVNGYYQAQEDGYFDGLPDDGCLKAELSVPQRFVF